MKMWENSKVGKMGNDGVHGMKNDGAGTGTPYRRTARIVGLLFIVGTVAGVLSVFVTGPVLDGPDYLVKVSANGNQLVTGALLVLVMGLSLAIVGVMMYPILKKHNGPLAMGYVVFRSALETATCTAGVVCWLALLTLSREYVNAGAPANSQFQTLGTLLTSAGTSISQMGSIVFSLGAIMLYYVLYRSKLVPSWLALWGLAGAVLYLAAPILAMFGSGSDFLMAPLAVQEMVFAAWLIIKGFDVPKTDERPAMNETRQPSAGTV